MCQTWHDNHGTWKWGRITILRLFLMVCFWFCFWKYECYLQEWKSSPAWQLLILTDLSISIVLWTVKGTEYHPISPWQPCTSSLHTLESLFLPCYLPLKGMLEFFWSSEEYLWTHCPFLWAAAGKKLIYKGLHSAWKGNSWRKCSLQSAQRKIGSANLRMVGEPSSEIRRQTREGCKGIV